MGVRVGVVGATGQVGVVMRKLLAERNFPADEVRFFASARSAGKKLPWRGGEIVVEDAADGRPDRARHRAVLGGRDPLACAGAAVRGRRRDRGRQLVGVAQGPRGPAGRERGQPGAGARPAQGHHRQPELHHDGRDAGAQGAARRGRSAAADRLAVPGGVRQRAGRRRGAARAGPRGRRRRREAGARRQRRDFPAPDKYVAPIAFNVIPLAGALVDDGSGRDRRGPEAAQREPQDPRPARPAGQRHLRAGARVHRPLAVDQRRVRAPAVGRARQELLAAAPGVELVDVPTPLAAAGRRPVARRPDPSGPRRPRRPRPGAVRLGDNLRKGAALNTIQIAEVLVAGKAALAG